jgi:hypothetical protein
MSTKVAVTPVRCEAEAGGLADAPFVLGGACVVLEHALQGVCGLGHPNFLRKAVAVVSGIGAEHGIAPAILPPGGKS